MKIWGIGRNSANDSVTHREKIVLQNPRNSYYDNVSSVYHALFLILLVALLVFVCVALLYNT